MNRTLKAYQFMSKFKHYTFGKAKYYKLVDHKSCEYAGPTGGFCPSGDQWNLGVVV